MKPFKLDEEPNMLKILEEVEETSLRLGMSDTDYKSELPLNIKN